MPTADPGSSVAPRRPFRRPLLLALAAVVVAGLVAVPALIAQGRPAGAAPLPPAAPATASPAGPLFPGYVATFSNYSSVQCGNQAKVTNFGGFNSTTGGVNLTLSAGGAPKSKCFPKAYPYRTFGASQDSYFELVGPSFSVNRSGSYGLFVTWGIATRTVLSARTNLSSTASIYPGVNAQEQWFENAALVDTNLSYVWGSPASLSDSSSLVGNGTVSYNVTKTETLPIEAALVAGDVYHLQLLMYAQVYVSEVAQHAVASASLTFGLPTGANRLLSVTLA